MTFPTGGPGNKMSSQKPESSHIGPKSTGGMAAETQTPANRDLGVDKPKAFDAQGTIGKQFTGEYPQPNNKPSTYRL